MHYLIIAVLALGLSLMGCEGKTGPAGPSGSTGAAGPAGPAGPQGSTGPAGPQGPQGETGPAGPAGADGADGAQGPQGEKGDKGDPGADGADGADGAQGPPGPQGEKGDTGEQGPQGEKGDTGPAGPQGEAATLPPGLSPEEILGILSADHVAAMVLEHSSEAYGGLAELTPARIGDGTSILLRVGQEATVKAVVRTQDGAIVEGADLVWSIDEEEENISVEDGVITALASNYNIDDAKYSASMVSFKSASHLVAGELSVMVSNAVAKVKLSQDSLIPLAIGETTMITASALDGDDKPVPDLGMMGNYDWSSDSGSAGVAADKHASGEMKGKYIGKAGSQATITGKSSGDASITAAIEGQSASVDVAVSGSSITRTIIYTDPDTRTFTWDRDPAASSAWEDGTITTTFDVELYNAISDAQISNFDNSALTLSVSGNKASTVGLLATTPNNAANGVVTVQVAVANFDAGDPSTTPPTAPAGTALSGTTTAPTGIHEKNAGSMSYIVELKVNGAVSKRIHFTIAYGAAPAE